jgi:hypothetical protein
MSTQIIFAHGDTSQGNPVSPLRGSCLASLAAGDSTPMVTAGTMKNFRVFLSSAPGAGASWTATIQKNDVDTALQVVISGAVATSGSDTTHTISFAAGDTIRVNWTTGGASSKAWDTSIEWTPTTTGEHIYEFSTDLTGGGSDTPAFGLVGAGGGVNSFGSSGLTAVAGTISKLRVNTRTAPSVGNSFTYRLFINSVAQDGSGGTTDTRATITAGNTTANSSFTPVAIAAGDHVSVRYSTTGGTTSAYDVGTVLFTPTTAEQSVVCMNGNSGPSNTVTNYAFPRAAIFVGFDAYSTSESVRQYHGAATASLVLSGMYVEMSVAPGSGKSRTFTLRKNGAGTSITVTISDAALSGNITGQSVSLAAGDTWSFECQASGTPASASVKAAFIMIATPAVTAQPVVSLLVSP